MTREEAEIFLCSIADDLGFTDIENYTCKDGEKMREAIKVLSQEPCDDAISRDAVDKYIARLLSGYLYDGERERLEIFSAYLWELPSVTQKSGKWIITHLSNMAYCSECDYLFKDIPASMVEHFKHCPNCGAKMESEDKECTKKI